MASISACLSLKPSIFHKHLQLHSEIPIVNLPIARANTHRRNGRAFSPIIRASIGASYRTIPGVIVESDRLQSDVRKRAMNAVDACGCRVTVGDVASRAGLKLSDTQKALQALVSDSDGFLEVSSDGELLYCFPKDHRSKIAAKSFKAKIEPLVEKGKSVAEYLVRVSFGTALVASILLVYTTIIAIVSSRSEDDKRERRRGRSYNSGFSVYVNPSDLFWYWDPYYYRRQHIRRDDERMNFLESVFSFVFGEGDPNHGIEEERWKLIGRYITANGGVVTAEELAPYLDLPPAERTNDESYVLPVLLRLDGEPEVDEGGNILYRFRSLQYTAGSGNTRREYVGRSVPWTGAIGNFLKEKEWQFSKTSISERAMVVGLGALNLLGVIVLSTMLRNMAVKPGSFIAFVADLMPLLQVYAGGFFAIPMIRWLLSCRSNNGIEQRNARREESARLLESPAAALRRKIWSAREMGRRSSIGECGVVYRSDKDFVEQDYELTDWDQRFQEL